MTRNSKKKTPLATTKGVFLEQIINHFVESSQPDLIVVDVQPEYAKSLPYEMYEFTEWLNENYEKFDSILFLYNGPDLGMVDEGELRHWYYEAGLSDDVLDIADFYDKGYAFFRYCIDMGIDDDDTVKLVRYMDQNNITDSRDIDDEVWEHFAKEYDGDELKELLQFAGDAIHLPDLMDELRQYNGDIILTGGSVEACLKEVHIALDALGKSYKILDQWTYYEE